MFLLSLFWKEGHWSAERLSNFPRPGTKEWQISFYKLEDFWLQSIYSKHYVTLCKVKDSSGELRRLFGWVHACECYLLFTL